MKVLRMNMRILVVAFVIASFAASDAQPAPAPAQTLGLDSSQPIAVNADTFLADLNGETGTYTGNVIVEQGAVRLHADEVKVVAPGGKASRMEANGHVVVDSPSGQAVGDNGIYDVPDQLLHLTGNVVLTKDAANAPPGQPPGRVQGLFVPAQKSPPPTQPAPPGP